MKKADIKRMRKVIASRGDCAGPLTTFPPHNGYSTEMVSIFTKNFVGLIEWLAMCEKDLPKLLDAFEALQAKR